MSYTNDNNDDDQDWGSIVASGFESAAAATVQKNFNNSEETTESKSVYVAGFRLSADWKASIWILFFTTLIWGGFAAMHVVRIIDGNQDSNNNSSNENNNNNSSSHNSNSSTTNPQNDDVEHFLMSHKVGVCIISLCVTGLAYLWTMSCMFLAVFTDPGTLPRKEELRGLLKSAGASGDPTSPTSILSNSRNNNKKSSFDDTNNNNPTSPVPVVIPSAIVKASSNILSDNKHNNNDEDDSNSNNNNNDLDDTRSSAASTAIVFASTKNPRLARGSIRASTVRDLLSEDGENKATKGPEFVVINNITIPTPFCSTCHIRRPVRASHCVTCQNCVMGFDHHCGVIGACIGQYNVRYFLGFVWGIGILSWLTGVSSALVAVGEHHGESDKVFALALMFCAICLILGIQLGCNLTCHYCCLFNKGYTHREWVKRDILYGGAGWSDEKSPFKSKSTIRQCEYLWCPPSLDADLKAWAEGRYDEVEQVPNERNTTYIHPSTSKTSPNKYKASKRVSLALGPDVQVVASGDFSSSNKREESSVSRENNNNDKNDDEEKTKLLPNANNTVSPGGGSSYSMDSYRRDGANGGSSSLSDQLLVSNNMHADEVGNVNVTPQKGEKLDYGATSPTDKEYAPAMKTQNSL